MQVEFDGDNPTTEVNSAFLGLLARDPQVKVVFLGCGESPAESQLAAVRQLHSGKVSLFQTLGEALLAEWNSSLRDNPDFFSANPVRSGLVQRPTDWKWSSARAYAGSLDVPLEIDHVDLE